MIPRFRFPDAFDRDLRLLTYSMSIRRVTMGFTMLIRSIYFALLGFSPVQIGLLLSIGTFVSALHHISFGVLSDRFGRKPFMVAGGVFSLLRLVIFAISSDFWMLALGQGLGAMGEGAGAGQPVVSGFIAERTARRDRGQVFGTLAISNGLASTVGSLMAGLPLVFQNTLRVDEVAGHAMLFWLGVIISIPSLLLLLPLRDREYQADAGPEESADAAPGDRDRNWGVIAKFSLVRSTSGLGWGFIQSLMSLYFFTQFGVGGEVLGPITSLARLLSVFTYLLAPAIVDRWGEVRPLVATRVMSAALAIALSLTPWYTPAILILIALRVVIMSTMPIRQTFAAGIVDPQDTATAIGVSNFARMSLRTIAPTVAGYMFEAISPAMPFASGAIFLVGEAFLYRAWFQPKKE
jgi:DHA1 family multidrug resistance protein-like MFS transporter